MVSRYDPEDELNIWHDANNDIYDDVDEQVHQAILNAIVPKKITEPKYKEPIVRIDLYRQLEEFIRAWAGDAYVVPKELFVLYKKHCRDNNQECLINNSKVLGLRMSRFTRTGLITRTVKNAIAYYYKPGAIKDLEGDEEKLSGKKRKALRQDENDQLPMRKKRRLDLTTWSSQKETEAFTLKISELEAQNAKLLRDQKKTDEFTLKISELETQVAKLVDVCKRQKALIDRFIIN